MLTDKEITAPEDELASQVRPLPTLATNQLLRLHGRHAQLNLPSTPELVSLLHAHIAICPLHCMHACSAVSLAVRSKDVARHPLVSSAGSQLGRC